MIFRLTAPNWELPSPYYGSHIIMSISGIYLLVSIHTLYHSLVLSLTQVHEITYFHRILHLLYIRPLRSAASHQLPTPAGPSLYIPCSFTAGDIPSGNCPWPHIYGHWSAGRLHPASSNWDIADVPYIFRRRNCPDLSAQVQQPSLLNRDLHSTIREQQVQTSNIIYTDKYNPVRLYTKHM